MIRWTMIATARPLFAMKENSGKHGYGAMTLCIWRTQKPFVSHDLRSIGGLTR